jgi:hypothetical protein
LQKKTLDTYTISRFSLIGSILFLLGSFLNIVSYSSFEPVIIGLIFLLIGLLILRLINISGRYEKQAFLIVFSTSFFWAGISALYANFLGDPSQLILDAANFYERSISGDYFANDFLFLFLTEEYSLPILIWQFFYEVFGNIGFEKGRYIGISVNILFVALTAVIGVRMVKNIFGWDDVRIKRFILTFAFCGLFWQFSAIHNRDASILFFITLLGHYWVRYLAEFSKSNFLRLFIGTILALASFAFLRRDFVFVPIAMFLVGLGVLIMGKKHKGSSTNILTFIVMLIIALGYYGSLVWGDLSETLFRGNEDYSKLANSESTSNSLGALYVVNQPILIRLIFGTIYLVIFPIPFWSGFQLSSAYNLFRSLNAIFMYALIPLSTLAVLQVIKQKTLRTPPILFLLFSFVGFILSVAGTSLELRHFGVFLPLLLILSMIPNLLYKRDLIAYRKLLILFFIVIVIIHLAWAIIKFM